jgi:hypothetical protein
MNKTNEATPRATNPLFTLLAGLGVGALIAALLPKSRHEDKHLGALGEKLRTSTKDAATAAKDAGLAHLDTMGINQDAARSQAQWLMDNVAKAAKAAGSAALESAAKK